jgi:hypothetical protein
VLGCIHFQLPPDFPTLLRLREMNECASWTARKKQSQAAAVLLEALAGWQGAEALSL